MRRSVLGSAVAAGLLIASPVPAGAQLFPRADAGAGTPCVLDRCVDGDVSRPSTRPPAPAEPRRGPVATGDFDFYVLSLSWSPAFCDTGGDAKSPDQCAEGRSLGFVVHGLWPQNNHGYPSNCDQGSRFPARSVFESVRDLYPDVGLARHEWRTHGTCSGLSPTDYFAAVRRARAAITLPATLQQPTEPQSLAPLDIARAFAGANRGLRPDSMAVTCRQGELQEVRLCFAKDLRGFVACPEVARDACRTRSVSVLPVR